jgi:hypothetical protein
MNNTTHDNVIPALQSMIARNRNDLNYYYRERMLLLASMKTIKKDRVKLFDYNEVVRNHDSQIKVIERIQKVAKKLLAREYAEERIREFNRQCQLARNK